MIRKRQTNEYKVNNNNEMLYQKRILKPMTKDRSNSGNRTVKPRIYANSFEVFGFSSQTLSNPNILGIL